MTTTQTTTYGGPRVSAVAGEALTRNRLVRLGTISNGALTATHATAAVQADGIAEEDAANGALVTVRLLTQSGVIPVTASAAITAGARVFQTAAGKVDDNEALGVGVGVALEAAAADGDQIRVIRREPFIKTYTQTVTAGQDTANQADITHGMGVAAPRVVALLLRTSAGVQIVTAATVTFPDTNTVRVALAALAANDIISITLAFEGV